MRNFKLSEWTTPILVISLAYLIAFFITFIALMPLQDSLLSSFSNYASILYLPHGVRIVAAWLYGWRSIIFLAPSTIIAHSYLYGYSGFSLDYMVAVFFQLFCAAFSFWSLAKLGMDFRLHNFRRVNWRDIMLAGCAASVMNVLGAKLFFGSDLASASARFVGDITGMIVSLFVLMLIFRALRRSGRMPGF